MWMTFLKSIAAAVRRRPHVRLTCLLLAMWLVSSVTRDVIAAVSGQPELGWILLPYFAVFAGVIAFVVLRFTPPTGADDERRER